MGFFDDLLKTAEYVATSKSLRLEALEYITGDYGQRYTDFFGGGNRPVPADSFTDGQDEDAALITYMTGAAYQAIQARMASGESTPADMVTLRSITRLQTGKASNIEQQMFIQAVQQSKFADAYRSGELDDPEALASAYGDWFQSMPDTIQAQLDAQAAAGAGFGAAGTGQLDETGAPIDEDLAWFQTQQEQQAEMDQLSYQRESLFNLMQMLPAQARLQAVPKLLEDPAYRRILFGEDEGSILGGMGPSGGYTPTIPSWGTPNRSRLVQK